MVQLAVMEGRKFRVRPGPVCIAEPAAPGFEPLGCALLVLEIVRTPSREENGARWRLKLGSIGEARAEYAKAQRVIGICQAFQAAARSVA
jgi:hypothetical protein